MREMMVDVYDEGDVARLGWHGRQGLRGRQRAFQPRRFAERGEALLQEGDEAFG